ncbi:MAG: HTH domain-containing protein [Candidatus Woesearchaeota archaeon]
MPSLENINQALKAAFLKIKAEFFNVKLWIDFFNAKILKNESEHAEIRVLVDEQNKRLDSLVSRLNEIEKKTALLESNVSSLKISEEKRGLEYEIAEIKKVHNDIRELFEAIKSELSKKKDASGHDKDMSGHDRDMIGTYQDVRKDRVFLFEKEFFDRELKKSKNFVVKKRIAEFRDENELSVTEKSLLKILYESDSPLTYADLSRMLGREEKTIRNSIYELRKKGFGINDKLVSSKEKAFYLTEEMKLKISGR